MKGTVFTARGRSRLLKTLQNVRVTLLCGLLTFIVLRSSLGAGKFGTPVQDYDEIQHQLHRFKLRRQQKLLLRRELTNTLREDTSRSTLSLPTEEGHANMRGHALYNKGFLDWFEQRHHPRNPQILLVTRPHSCKSAIATEFFLELLANKMDYCRLHGIEIIFNREAVHTSHRARVVQDVMLSHPKVEWIWWMDSFAMFVDQSPPRLESYAGYNIVCGNDNALISSNGGVLNVWEKLWSRGNVLLRNCEWSRKYLENDGQMQVAGEVLLDEPGVGNSEAGPPFVMHFGGCNVCGKDSTDLGCLSDMERALGAARRQKVQAGLL